MTDFDKAVRFLDTACGIKVSVRAGTNGFLPDILIEDGGLVVDHAGDDMLDDLLHEAGHIAVVPSMFRAGMNGDIGVYVAEALERYDLDHPNAFQHPEDPIARGLLQAGEQEAIAWSYAAAIALDLDLNKLFRKGFRGTGKYVRLSLQMNSHPGIHGLHASAMTLRKSRNGVDPFPHLLRWTQI